MHKLKRMAVNLWLINKIVFKNREHCVKVFKYVCLFTQKAIWWLRDKTNRTPLVWWDCVQRSNRRWDKKCTSECHLTSFSQIFEKWSNQFVKDGESIKTHSKWMWLQIKGKMFKEQETLNLPNFIGSKQVVLAKERTIIHRMMSNLKLK